MDTEPDTVVVYLTDRRPVEVCRDSWTVWATAHCHDDDMDHIAFVRVRARPCAAARAYVYGVASSLSSGERDVHSGYLVDISDERRLIRAIHRVAREIGHPDLARDCIADLPPVRELGANSRVEYPPNNPRRSAMNAADTIRHAITTSILEDRTVTICARTEPEFERLRGAVVALCESHCIAGGGDPWSDWDELDAWGHRGGDPWRLSVRSPIRDR